VLSKICDVSVYFAFTPTAPRSECSNCWKLAADAPEALRTIPAAAPEIVCSAPKARWQLREVGVLELVKRVSKSSTTVSQTVPLKYFTFLIVVL
jgi:hypothetical protein